MNMALDGESPYDNAELFNYLTRHMTVLKTTTKVPWTSGNNKGAFALNSNGAFYTTDGMRFEFEGGAGADEYIPLHENNEIKACPAMTAGRDSNPKGTNCGGCGSFGLNNNPNNTTKPPCFLLVDVNGDKKPTPGNINCHDSACARAQNLYKIPTPESKKVNDLFIILITEDRAFPFGVTAQKAMYQSQK